MTGSLAVRAPQLHDGSMPEPKTRRSFTAAYKLKILTEIEQCSAPGEAGAVLRREGLYSSHLTCWRAARKAGTLSGTPVRRGPKPAPVDLSAFRKLERRLAREKARADRAEAIIELQNKVASLLGEPLPPIDELD